MTQKSELPLYRMETDKAAVLSFISLKAFANKMNNILENIAKTEKVYIENFFRLYKEA